MHTIEAAICVSLIILLLAGVLMLGESSYAATRSVAVAVARSCVERVGTGEIYEMAYVPAGAILLPQIRTCPEKLTNMIAGFIEGWAPLREWFASLQAGQR